MHGQPATGRSPVKRAIGAPLRPAHARHGSICNRKAGQGTEPIPSLPGSMIMCWPHWFVRSLSPDYFSLNRGGVDQESMTC